MIGIDIGTSKITLSDGSALKLPSDHTPKDFLARVADESPYVRVTRAGVELTPACDMFATAVAHAVFDRQLMNETEIPVAVTVPSWWSTRVLTRVRSALDRQGVNAVLINEAEAAVAAFHASQGGSTPNTTQHVAVVGLGAQATSVVVVRTDATGPHKLAHPVTADTEGSSAVDAAVLRHLVRGLQELGDEIAVSEPATIRAARVALASCRQLKETLSITGTEALKPEIPNADHRIRIIRSELEELATPWADSIVNMLKSTLEQCAVEVDSVLLIGGPAAMPLVSQRVSADLGLCVQVPDDPATVAVRGSVMLLAERHTVPVAKHGLWAGLKRQFARLKVEPEFSPTEQLVRS